MNCIVFHVTCLMKYEKINNLDYFCVNATYFIMQSIATQTDETIVLIMKIILLEM